MKLYHGTSSRYKDAILSDGLLPRVQTGISNWSHCHDGTLESRPHLVYLTTAYPVYFAWQAAKNNDDLLILCVEVSPSSLFPDEDFLAFVAHQKGMFPGMRLHEITPLMDPEANKHLAKSSLQFNGVASIKRVKPTQIVQSVTIPSSDVQTILMIGGDSMPIPMNYKFLGDMYQKSIEALFAGGSEAARKVVCETMHVNQFEAYDTNTNGTDKSIQA